MPVAHVRDIDLYYEVHGAGRRVLLISGTGGDLARDPSRHDGPLQQRFEVLMYDQRGLGQSGKPDAAYTMFDYADDAAALLDHVGWSSCHVVGVSFGGMVAQHLAIRHPDRVSRLVLACSSAGGEGGSSFDLRELDDLESPERLRRWLPVLDSRNNTSSTPWTLAPGFDQLAASTAQDPGDTRRAVGARRQLDARAGHDAWDQLARITSETLIAGGRYDMQAPATNQTRLASRIVGARLEFFDGGHLFLWQDPTAWSRIVAFLDGDLDGGSRLSVAARRSYPDGDDSEPGGSST